MQNRELLMLAQVFDSDRHNLSGWFVSIKLDGQRAFWDGGITMGLPKVEVPWANLNKDERYREPPICTGLWSRYGNIIHAPQRFLNDLPKGIFLDGELFLGRGRFQDTRRIVSTLEPGSGWENIKYRVFEIPPQSMFFQGGKINNPQFMKIIDEDKCLAFYKERSSRFDIVNSFDVTVSRMNSMGRGQYWSCLKQIRLSYRDDEAKEQLLALLEKEVDLGGEGLIVRAPGSVWCPKRSSNLLKVKNFDESEATVLGFVNGYGKHKGRMGALVIEWGNKEFQLSGFTDEEREYDSLVAQEYAWNHEGELMVGPHTCKLFKRGDQIRFRYRGLTDDGIPREARYWR